MITGTGNQNWLERIAGAGLVRKEDLENIRRTHPGSESDILAKLIEKGLVSEEQLLFFFTKETNTPRFKNLDFHTSREVLTVFNKQVAEKYHVLPVMQINKSITVATPFPLEGAAIDFLSSLCSLRVKPIFIRYSQYKEALSRLYDATDEQSPSDEEVFLEEFLRSVENAGFLGDILMAQGAIKMDQLMKALEVQRRDGGLLGEVLLKLKIVTEEEIVVALASQFNYPYLSVENFTINPDALKAIPLEVVIEYMCLPIDKLNNILTVVMADPSNKKIIKQLEQLSGCRIQAFVSTVSEIEKMIRKQYKLLDIPRSKTDSEKVNMTLQSASDPKVKRKEKE